MPVVVVWGGAPAHVVFVHDEVEGARTRRGGLHRGGGGPVGMCAEAVRGGGGGGIARFCA